MKSFAGEFIRITLGLLLAFAALNAFGGGLYAMSGAKNVPAEWLEGSPFESYFIPGVILFFIVGGSFFFASVAVFARFRLARMASVSSVVVTIIWLVMQVYIIGFVSWLQSATAIMILLILILTLFLPRQPRKRI